MTVTGERALTRGDWRPETAAVTEVNPGIIAAVTAAMRRTVRQVAGDWAGPSARPPPRGNRGAASPLPANLGGCIFWRTY